MTTHRRTPRRLSRAGFLAAAAALALLLGLAGCGQKSPQDQYLAAQTALQGGDSMGAMVKCQKLIESHPTDPAAQQARMMLAAISMKSGDSKETIRLINEVLDTEGSLKSQTAQSALTGLLSIYGRMEKYDDIVAEIEKRAKDLDAEPEFGWRVRSVFLVQSYVKKKEVDQALKVLADLQATAKDETDAFRAIGQGATLLASEKKYDDAVALFQDYLDTHADTKMRWQALLEIAAVHDAAAMDTEDKEAREAETKKAEETRDQVIPLLREVYDTELGRNRLEAGLQLVDVYRQATRFDKALDMIATLRTDNVTSATADLDALLYTRECDIYRDQDLKDKVIETLQKGIEAHAGDNSRTVLLGYQVDFYVDTRQYDRAKELLEKLCDEFPDTNISKQATMGLRALAQKIEQEANATSGTAAGAADTTSTAAAAPQGNE